MVSRNWLPVAMTLSLIAPPALLALPAPRALPAPAGPWREDARFIPLFASRGAPPGSYRAYVSDLGLAAALEQIRQDPTLSSRSGAWQVRVAGPFEVFGQSGSYNRWKVARLYGARQAQVARGPRFEDGRAVEAWTLVSPFPDHTLQHLNAGTLLIVLRLP